MKIKKIRLKNGYKRFRDLTIDLGDNPARVVALVGPNGCGKSSVLDGALYLFRAYHQLGREPMRDYNYHSMDGSPSYNYDNVEIEFVEGDFKSVFRARKDMGKEGTIFSFRSPYRFNSNLKVTASQATSELRLNDYGAGDAASLDSKMEQSYRRLYAAYNRYMETADVRPSEAKTKIIGDLNQSIKNCLDLEVSSLGNIDDAKGTLFFRKNGHPKEFEFNVLSSGEKEVVDILLDLYLRSQDYCDSVFLIDEPELHINTSIQRKLLIEINRLVGENCQIWLTTHSIGFLRALQTEMHDQCQIIHFDSELDLASSPHVLQPSKPTRDLWRKLLAVALDDLASLVSPKTIVYCEGRADPDASGAERGLDAKVLNKIFGSTHPETLFVSSGGNTELDQRSEIAIQILGKALPELDIWVLKDRDMASGKSVDENDRQTYLRTNSENHRVLKRWEIENYLYDKEVLEAYCAGEGLIFAEAAYDAFVTDIANQNLKDETSRIKNFCGITSSVNPETFKLCIAHYLGDGKAAFEELKACIFNRA